ncbi:MAG: hypothetical protein KC478_02690 [Bacteriovoracaceae bacterium]|nr:hypothetical protein [Bacteriovoracaceae bacterium]
MKLILITILFSNFALAILDFEDAAYPELMTSSRALAMGNAYMNKVDDSWSAFYNPAGLGTVRGVQFHLTNIHLETNNGYLDVTGGSGSFLDSTSNYTKAFKADGLRDLLADDPGKMSHARVALFPNITFRGLTLGWLYSQQNRGRLKSATADFELAERVDWGPVIALNLSLFGGVVKFGISGTYLTRKQIQKDFGASDPTTIDEDVDYKKGSMTYLVAGTRITLPVFMLPTFSVVYRNSSNGQWYDTELGGAPDKIPQTIDGGFSITPYTARNARLHLEVNYKDMGNFYEDVGMKRKLLVGMEFDWARTFFFRLGAGDGWGSGGIGVRNKRFIFDLTTYAIEASRESNAYREEEDRRYVLSIASGF